MASFGHLAVGLMAGRLHDQGRTQPARSRQRAATMIVFGLLGMLPDADVLLVTLGVTEGSAAGHRGASHSLLMAVMMGIAAGLLARRYGWSALRTALAITLAIGSHGILDTFGQGGRAIPLLWPLSDHRFMAPWRCLPDAPRGLQFISRDGFLGAALEFVYFLPVTAFALWPRRGSTVAPTLAIVDGGARGPAPRTSAAAAALAAASPSEPDAIDDTEREEPSLRSLG